MADNQSPPAGPDLALGVSPDDLENDMLLGHVGEADVLLVRVGLGDSSRSTRIAAIITARSPTGS